MIQETITYYLIIIDIVTFLAYGIDKWKAKKAMWRIRETSLLMLAVLGGSIGAWLGMKVWHHKTMHKKFKYGVPLILMAQIALLFFISCKVKQKVESITLIQHETIQEHSPNVFLIMYDKEIGKGPLLKAIREYKCELIYDYNIINGVALKKPNDKSLEETMLFFKKVKGVTNVEYDHVYHLTDPIKPRLEIR